MSAFALARQGIPRPIRIWSSPMIMGPLAGRVTCTVAPGRESPFANRNLGPRDATDHICCDKPSDSRHVCRDVEPAIPSDLAVDADQSPSDAGQAERHTVAETGSHVRGDLQRRGRRDVSERTVLIEAEWV